MTRSESFLMVWLILVPVSGAVSLVVAPIALKKLRLERGRRSSSDSAFACSSSAGFCGSGA